MEITYNITLTTWLFVAAIYFLEKLIFENGSGPELYRMTGGLVFLVALVMSFVSLIVLIWK